MSRYLEAVAINFPNSVGKQTSLMNFDKAHVDLCLLYKHCTRHFDVAYNFVPVSLGILFNSECSLDLSRKDTF